MTWNPRYVAFAKAHGRTPEQQHLFDDEKWPGGRGIGFSLWISQQKLEAHKANHPSVVKDLNGLHVTEHALWDAWLSRESASRLPDDP